MASIREIVAKYLKIYYAKNQILDVEATFAKKLTKEQRERLIHNLEIKTEKKDKPSRKSRCQHNRRRNS